MQDIGKHKDTLSLAPACLHSIVSGQKVSMSDFVRTTDVEVMYMIRSFAAAHSDRVLKYLANLFVSRSFPKCVLEFATSDGAISKKERSDESESSVVAIPAAIGAIAEDVRSFVAEQLQQSFLPVDAAKHLVWLDRVDFSSTPTDLLLSFPGQIVPADKIESNCAGFDLTKLLEPFAFVRLFVPREFESVARGYITKKYGMNLSP
jgi:hypothetical protein